MPAYYGWPVEPERKQVTNNQFEIYSSRIGNVQDLLDICKQINAGPEDVSFYSYIDENEQIVIELETKVEESDLKFKEKIEKYLKSLEIYRVKRVEYGHISQEKSNDYCDIQRIKWTEILESLENE